MFKKRIWLKIVKARNGHERAKISFNEILKTESTNFKVCIKGKNEKWKETDKISKIQITKLHTRNASKS